MAHANRSLYVRAAKSLLRLPIIMGLLLFLPTWTLRYWEAWLFMAVFFACSLAVTVGLAVRDPELLERRLNVGPRAEKEKTQKIIMALAMTSFIAILLLPAIDHRFGWSSMPPSLVILGNVLVILGYIAVWLVFRENTYGASTIQLAEDQHVISTGPYALMRHPMYSGAVVMLLGIPLALGSWWGFLMFIPAVAGIVWRLTEEEKFLARNLPGYTEYMSKVRYRLIPFVW